MSLEQDLENKLAEIRADGRFRQLRVVSNSGALLCLDGKTTINFSTNDYLGFSRNEDVLRGCLSGLETYGSAATSSRLVGGTFPVYLDLEQRLASFKNTESCLVFGAGYLANIGVISSIVGRNDLVFSDKLCHASLLDGIVLSRAKQHRFRHNDMLHLEQLLRESGKDRNINKFIVAESVYSMDGDLAPLEDLYELARSYDAALIIDEAHAIGVFSGGRGRIVQPPKDVTLIQTATLSKAFAAYGGLCFCSQTVCDYLINCARSFIFNTAVPPVCVSAALSSLDLIEEDCERGELLLERAKSFAVKLRGFGIEVGDSYSHILPLHIGDNLLATRATELLLEKGVLVTAIRPPTVPQGTARLRLSLTAAHTEANLDYASLMLKEVFSQLGLL